MKDALIAALKDDPAFAASVLEALLPHLDVQFTASTERITDWFCATERRDVTVKAKFKVRIRRPL